ncbi:unnamed protein product [Rhizoctonia solani]|uniref:Uncharacterized protein n=1 Tax=Rhizoctonia solani TaxID=456999 RepID=A0A8H2XDX5_9AGAM|nr:unnamed protein product [Rhizoctonia solani]
MFSYTATFLKAVVVATLKNTIRRFWADDQIQFKFTKNDGEPELLSSAYIVGVSEKPSALPNPTRREFRESGLGKARPEYCAPNASKSREPKVIKVSLGPQVNISIQLLVDIRLHLYTQPEVSALRGTKIVTNAYSYGNADDIAPVIKVNTRQSAARESRSSIIPEPIKLANLASNIQTLQAEKGMVERSRPQVTGPVPSIPGPTKALKTNRSLDYVVPFPRASSGTLRASESAPARLSRMKTPSKARRILPAKRPSKTQDEVEPAHVKRRRVLHPYVSPVQTLPTPPGGSLAALIIPSPLTNSPHVSSIRSSESIMSLSELAHGRPLKRVRSAPNSPGPATRHELSSSGKPGALAHVPSLEPSSTVAEDVEMGALDATETPEVTMSSPGFGNFDEWMSVPSTPTMDEETKAPLDDEVEMKERAWDGDVMMWYGYKGEDEVMRDWTDEDVMMGGVT